MKKFTSEVIKAIFLNLDLSASLFSDKIDINNEPNIGINTIKLIIFLNYIYCCYSNLIFLTNLNNNI